MEPNRGVFLEVPYIKVKWAQPCQLLERNRVSSILFSLIRAGFHSFFVVVNVFVIIAMCSTTATTTPKP